MCKKNMIIERKAMIFNIQKYNMYDGPGLRTIIFFQGCPLRCKWCANPEGLEKKFKVMFRENLCNDCGECVKICPKGIHEIDKETRTHIINRNIECIGCGKCEEVCYKTALSVVGEGKTISELLEIIESDRTFYETSGGGVTLGGGEVLMQPEAALNLLMACKYSGINTAIETSGFASEETILKVAEFTDLFLIDIKNINSEKHLEWTGVRNESILKNISKLIENNNNVQIRMPILKGINDKKEDIEKIMEFLKPYKNYKNFKGIDLLPYHKMGIHKYKQLGLEYLMEEDPSISNEELDCIETWIKNYDFQVKLIKH